MGDNENNKSPPDSAVRRDGNIDFSRYSTEQLRELRDTIDPQSTPLNYVALIAELDRRKSVGTEAAQWTGRYTRRDGLRGWLEAKWRRLPLYGAALLRVTTNTLILQGWQRTWLGVPIDRALHIPLERVRNVIATASGLRFEVARRGWFPKRVELFQSPEERDGLLQALPSTRTRRFDQRAASLLAFEEQLLQRCKTAWMTPVLILLNVLVFIAAAISGRGVLQAGSSALTLWMANIGPLVFAGQWWRLVTALFVHANLLHLALNMWALWHVGRLTERLFGRLTFLALYLAAGILASLTTLSWDPAQTSVGASGAIFALFGAFLACLIRRGMGIPRGIFRSHWIPTLLFVAFNLFSGAVQTGIDNAAHIGGLCTGFVLGVFLFRPLHAPGTARLPRARWATASAVFLILASSMLWYVYRDQAIVPVARRFAAEHQWYVASEARAVAAWQQLAARAGSGTISDDELGRRVKAEVLPFWQSAQGKLQTEVSSATGEEHAYLAELANYARIRRDWAQAIIDATEGRDREKIGLVRKLDTESSASVARISRLAARSEASRMAGGVVNLPFVRTFRARLGGHGQDCVKEPAAYGIQPAPTDSPTDSPSMLQSAGCRSQRLLVEEDFATLDRLLSQNAAQLGDLPDGSSTFPGLTGGLGEMFTYGSGTLEEYLRKLARWRRAVPESFYPDLVEAMMYNVWAWSARGTGFANQIAQQSWEVFAFRNEMARAALEGANPLAQRDPLWCGLSLRLAHDRADGLEKIRQIFDDCMRMHPRYLALYGAMLRSLQPRWFGSAEKVADFIRISADAAEMQQDALYARLYWYYADIERDDTNIFQDTYANWDRVQSGFEELRSAFPKSDLIINGYARMACLAGNAATYRSLRPELEKRRSATGWTETTTITGCDAKLLDKTPNRGSGTAPR